MSGRGQAAAAPPLVARRATQTVRPHNGRVLVVLDTNAFYSDLHGSPPRLRGILDAPVNQAAFEVLVAAVVLRALDKHFARRSKKVVREMNKAFGELKDELAALRIAPLERWHDVDLGQVILDDDERPRRSSRPPAAWVFMYDLDYPGDGPVE